MSGKSDGYGTDYRVPAGGWADMARKTIEAIHDTLPKEATLKERKAALRAGYPFGERAMWPYKAWCKAQRAYLARFDTSPVGMLKMPESPMERSKRRSAEVESRRAMQ
jgi:hypothetical protein